MAIAILLLLIKIPRLHYQALRRPALGDIGITLLVVVLGLMTATFSGLITGAIAGILISIYFSVGNKVVKRREEIIINPDRPRLALPRPSLPKRQPMSEIEKIERDCRETMTYKRALEIIRG